MLLSFLDAALEHTPRPSSRACSGRLSPGLCWQVKPEPQRAVYTPHACPSVRAQVMQQPQPGSFSRSAQSFGSGLHSSSAPASHGSQRTTGPMVSASRTNAASAARQSRQGPGILPIKLVTKGQYVSCRAGLGGLSATQRTGYPSPSVFSFTRTSRFIQAEKEPTSHTLLCMNNVNGNPDMRDRYTQSMWRAAPAYNSFNFFYGNLQINVYLLVISSPWKATGGCFHLKMWPLNCCLFFNLFSVIWMFNVANR